MIRRSLDESSGQFWLPAEFKNVENLDFEKIKNLKNQGNLELTEPSMPYLLVVWKI